MAAALALLSLTLALGPVPERLAPDCDLLLAPGAEPWPADLLEDLRIGLARLPAALRQFPGGPLELVRRDEARPFGMGDGSRAAPDWADGRRSFFLYPVAPSTNDRRAQWRLDRLSRVEQTRLWRARALVHAVLQRWDDVLGMSRRPLWGRLNGWQPALGLFADRPLNTAEGAFSRARGRASASLDLVTFAEELFVPAEAVREDALALDETVGCQEFSKARAFLTLLHEAGLSPEPVAARCPAFEEWAELDQLSHLEVLLVTASGRRPESLFGHLLLRPVYRQQGRVRAPSFETAVQIAAMTEDPHQAGLGYAVRGIFGGYSTVVSTVAWGDFAREALVLEQRTIRRFRLNLSGEENRRTLERVWELERRGAFDYHFFSANCASVLAFLIAGALPEQSRIEIPGMFLVAPGTVLDGLAATRVSGSESGPLLSYEPGDLLSAREIAERAERSRVELENDLLADLPSPARRAAAEAFRGARDPRPAKRREAFESMAGLSRLTCETSCRRHLYEWWAQTVRAERYLLDGALQRRRQIEADAVIRSQVLPGDPSPELAERQRLLERESRLHQHWMVLDRAQKREELAATLPRRPLTSQEREELAATQESERTFDRLVELHGDLVESRFAEEDPTALLEREAESLRADQLRTATKALPESGAWRAAAGVGARLGADSSVTPTVAVYSAGLAELLGDQRRHGFRSGAEMRVLEGELQLRSSGRWPAVARSDFTLFGYRTLLRELPRFRTSWWDALGWGAATTMSSREWRLLPDRAGITGELLAPLAASADFDSLAAVGLGAGWFGGWGGGRLGAGLGPRVSLSVRLGLPGHSAQALRLEGSYQWSMLLLAGGEVSPAHELEAAIGADFLLGNPQRFALLVKPRIQIESGSDRNAGWRGAASALVWFEPL